MVKALKIAVVLVIVLTAVFALTACNIPDDEVETELREAIQKTKENGFDIEFTYNHEVLELYSGKQLEKYLKEDDGDPNRTNTS